MPRLATLRRVFHADEPGRAEIPNRRAPQPVLDLPATPGLRTGMFGRAIFPLGVQKVVAVPLAAMVERGQLQSVFAVEDGVAHIRLVTTGRRTKDAVEVLSGLNAGEKVVLPT